MPRLPEWTTSRPKQPYRAPGSAAFKESRPDYLELLLSDHELAGIGCLDAKFARRLVDKVMTSPVEEVSTKEDQTFLYLLTTAVLHQQFVRGGGTAPAGASSAALNLRVTVDNRRAVQRVGESR